MIDTVNLSGHTVPPLRFPYWKRLVIGWVAGIKEERTKLPFSESGSSSSIKAIELMNHNLNGRFAHSARFDAVQKPMKFFYSNGERSKVLIQQLAGSLCQFLSSKNRVSLPTVSVFKVRLPNNFQLFNRCLSKVSFQIA